MRDHRNGPPSLVMPHDLDRAGEHDADARRDLADAGQRLAFGIAAQLAEPARALDLGRLQPRKHLIAARIDDRTGRSGHAVSDLAVVRLTHRVRSCSVPDKTRAAEGPNCSYMYCTYGPYCKNRACSQPLRNAWTRPAP